MLCGFMPGNWLVKELYLKPSLIQWYHNIMSKSKREIREDEGYIVCNPAYILVIKLIGF